MRNPLDICDVVTDRLDTHQSTTKGHRDMRYVVLYLLYPHNIAMRPYCVFDRSLNDVVSSYTTRHAAIHDADTRNNLAQEKPDAAAV